VNLKDKASISKGKLAVLLLTLVLATALLTSAFNYVVLSNLPDTNLALDVEVQPRDAKLTDEKVRSSLRFCWVILE